MQYVQKGSLSTSSGGFKKIIASPWFGLVLGLLILGFVTYPTLKNYVKQKAIEKEISEIESEIAQYKDKNEDLRGMLDYLKSDQAVEENARLNLGLKKAGEKVIVITRSNKIEENSTSNNNAPVNLNNPERWWHLFFN